LLWQHYFCSKADPNEIHLCWLKEHLDTGESLDAIVGTLTTIGIDVEYPWRRRK
jgi:hypothetical protein